MKVVTINPPFLKNYSRQSRSPCVAKSGTIYYSYYLAYAGCAAELAGAEVTHIDSIAFELDFDSTLEKVVSVSPDLVVIDTSTPSIKSDISFASLVKKHLPNALVFCVGTFPSKNTKVFFELASLFNHRLDGCLKGEYEETVYNLCLNLENWRNIEGISYFLEDGSYKEDVLAQKTSAEFLDKLPFISEF